jgi:ABC-type phosphate transport system auxiliary subunit
MEEDSQSQLVKESERLQGRLEQLQIQLTALQQGGGENGRTDVANRAPQSGPQEKITAQEWEIT